MTQRTTFRIILRADHSHGEDTAVRVLRAFLKTALRAWGLRCISAERIPDENENTAAAASTTEGTGT